MSADQTAIASTSGLMVQCCETWPDAQRKTTFVIARTKRLAWAVLRVKRQFGPQSMAKTAFRPFNVTIR
jgi:hypothetical protein